MAGYNSAQFLLIAGLTCAACHGGETEQREEPTPIAVHCVPVTRGDLARSVTLRGRVAPPPGEDLKLSSQVPGRIVETKVSEGDRIAPGTLIAVLDDPTSRDVARQAAAGVSQARASKKNAEATLERARSLAARGLTTGQDLENAEASASRAAAELRAAEASAHGAERVVRRLSVRSAFAGTVIKVWRGAGAVVDGTDATPIVELAPTELEFVAAATEQQLRGIAPELPASIELLSAARPLKGAVRARPQALDPNTGIGEVRILLESGDGQTLVGSFGSVTIRTELKHGVLNVPAAALRGALSDGAELVVCKNDKAEVRGVKLGAETRDRVEIVSGLSEGDRVAVDHVLGLETGSLLAAAP